MAGQRIDQIQGGYIPPCVGERSTFMAPFQITRAHRHPYSDSSKLHKHFKPATVTYAPYSAGCVPFRWVARKGMAELTRDLRLYDLRHSCATLLVGAGVNPKIVSERLGHASIVL